MGTDKSNKIAELGRPGAGSAVRLNAVRNLNPALDEAISTNNNRYEMTIRERDGEEVYEYYFIIGNRVYQSNDGDGDFFATNNEQFLEVSTYFSTRLIPLFCSFVCLSHFRIS